MAASFYRARRERMVVKVLREDAPPEAEVHLAGSSAVTSVGVAVVDHLADQGVRTGR